MSDIKIIDCVLCWMLFDLRLEIDVDFCLDVFVLNVIG